MYQINNIFLSINENENLLKNKISEKTEIPLSQISEINILKKSIDSRKKNSLKFVYTLTFKIINNTKYKNILNSNKYVTKIIPQKLFNFKINSNKNLNPIIIGTGPAGIFAALTLLKAGIKPILFEQGKNITERSNDIQKFWKKRILNENSNIQFGAGGAGTFSDGKLVSGIKSIYRKFVLETFVKFGAPKEILYLNKPHIGTDYLKKIIDNICSFLQDNKVKINFNSKLNDIIIKNNQIQSIKINSKKFDSRYVILAIGHSSRDTFEMLYNKKINIEQKNFAVGIRIEHLQKDINFSQYNKFYMHPRLGAADYKLTFNDQQNSAYTFCMCPGGYVLSACSEKNMLVINGMSNFKRNALNSNSAIVVPVTQKHLNSIHPLAGIDFQRKLEKKAFEMGGSNYNAPVQLVQDFINEKPSKNIENIIPSYKPDFKLCDINDCFPEFISQTLKNALLNFDKKIKNFASNGAIITAIETRTSSPVKIIRNKNFESNIKGIFPIGEGAGYAGGIMSAAVDGINCAINLIKTNSI